VTCLLAIDEELTFITAIPKLPLNVGLHPGGAESVGEMADVTACGKGEALTMAARARIARVNCMLAKLFVLANGYSGRAMERFGTGEGEEIL